MRTLVSGALAGQHILITRPEGQADHLINGIRSLGGEASHIPFLAIKPMVHHSDLQTVADRLASYRACLFVSANAVQMSWPVLTQQQAWPTDLVAATVGPGTARCLVAAGAHCVLFPEHQFDSEGLLALPFFAPEYCAGRRFALIRGEGGRDFLASRLRERGAVVDEVALYARELHPYALKALQQLMASRLPSWMIVTSSESLNRLMSEAPPALATVLRTLPIVAPHARIAEIARHLGFKQVFVSAGGDAGILDFLQTYNVYSSSNAADRKSL